jgi:TolB-like protein/Flp pilus assembly protein TadD
MALQNFVSELKNRGVYQVAAVYAAAAWALLQVADIAFPLMGLPDRAISFLLLTAALFFPVALILAWMLDWTPAGIRVTSNETPRSTKSTSSFRLIEFVILVFLVGLVGYLYWERLILTRTIEETAAKAQVEISEAAANPDLAYNSIAVLPFATMSDRAEDSYFGDGLAEEILNLLAKLRELKVAARTSSFAYRDNNEDVREIARVLGVRHILEGSVRRSDKKIRVTAQLIDAASGFHLWSETYDRNFEDIFQIQDNIAQQVTQALQLILSKDSTALIQTQPTENLEAYDYYLQAKDYLRRPVDENTLDSALSLLHLAIDLDPEFAAARAAICSALLDYYHIQRSKDYFTSAERACYAALTLDVESVQVYIALGNLYLTSGQLGMAEAQIRKAVVMDPENIEGSLAYSDLFLKKGEHGKALATLDHLLEKEPRHWQAHYKKAVILFETGELEQSVISLNRTLELSPDNQHAYNALGSAYFMMGRFRESSEAFSKSLAMEPTTVTYSNIGTSYFYQGEFEQAAAMYRKAINMASDDYELRGNLGEALWYSGDSVAARKSYEKAIELARDMLQVNPENAFIIGSIGLYQARMGKREKALLQTNRALEILPVTMITQYIAAWTFTSLQDFESATLALQQAIALGYPVNLAASDPALDALMRSHLPARQLVESQN